MKDAQAVDQRCALGSDMMQISPGLGYHGATAAHDLPSLILPTSYPIVLGIAPVGRDFSLGKFHPYPIIGL